MVQCRSADDVDGMSLHVVQPMFNRAWPLLLESAPIDSIELAVLDCDCKT